MTIPLDPDKAQREELSQAVLAYLEGWQENAPEMLASGIALDHELIAKLGSPPGEEGRPILSILEDVDAAAQSGIYHASGGHLSYIPNAGLYSGAIADLLGSGLNRYTGVAGAAPGFSAIEHGAVRWILDLFEFPPEAAGVLLSGGSTANFTGVVAARTAKLGDGIGKGVAYVTDHTHHSFAKAARLAGIAEANIRVVPIDASLRMDTNALAQTVRADRESGLDPFLVVASAGTTDTGTIDDLPSVSAVAKSEDLWLHIDAAYGGFFQLTDRGRSRLRGIELADSIAVDPHKGLSLPFGVGALLAKKEAHLVEANQGRGAYLEVEDQHLGLRDIASLGPELSRPNRGLAVWLPLQLHGVAAFRQALDEALDLAEAAHERLRGIAGIETPWAPDLSIVAFRLEDDEVGRAALAAVNRDRRTHISATVIGGRYILRFAILNRRTSGEHLNRAIDIIEKTLQSGS